MESVPNMPLLFYSLHWIDSFTLFLIPDDSDIVLFIIVHVTRLRCLALSRKVFYDSMKMRFIASSLYWIYLLARQLLTDLSRTFFLIKIDFLNPHRYISYCNINIRITCFSYKTLVSLRKTEFFFFRIWSWIQY